MHILLYIILKYDIFLSGLVIYDNICMSPFLLINYSVYLDFSEMVEGVSFATDLCRC